ncbi:tetratricopeptide repeat-containing sensor histidine kinase, partial [Chitinophaga sp.]|uniref:tetratricopeptide repeat-containing sensor histidine kinase n=1 Tax=Chitinophaga sp. TaxID=1869181 RepID=UPI002C23CCD3
MFTRKIFTGYFIAGFFLLLSVSCRQHSSEAEAKRLKAQEDSLLNYLNSHFNPLINNHEFAKARQLMDSMTTIMATYPSVRMQFNILTTRGTFYNALPNLDSALYYYQQALELAQKKDTGRKLTITADYHIGEVYMKRKNFPEALKRIRAAYDYRSKYDTANMDITCFRLAELYRSMGNEAEQKKYLLEGLGRTSNPRLRTVIANNLSAFYNYHGNLDSAIWYLDNYIIPDTTLYHPMYQAGKYESKGVYLRQQGKYEEALKYTFKALDIQRTQKKFPPVTYYHAANIYISMKNYPQALKYIDTCINLASKEKDTTLVSFAASITDAWEQKAGLHYTMGQYKNASESYYEALGTLRAYTDSAYARQIIELEDQYALKAKDEKILRLDATNRDAAKITRLQRIIIAGFIGFVLLTAVFLLMFYKRRKLREKLRQAELEQKLLRSQMEPHFIFNTLAVLQAMVRNQETEKSISYLSSFASLLRVNLEHSQSAFVPLEQEVEALSNYLNLQALRFENAFDYFLHVPDNMDDIFIPPMLLQPFVENAVQHGVQELDYKGIINIDIRKEGNMLHCIIEDNGTGIQENKPAGANNKQSLSTQINKKRLEMLSRKTGKQSRLEIKNKAD